MSIKKLFRPKADQPVVENCRSGLAIIEIMIGFMMISFLLTGLVVAGLYVIRGARYAQERSIATKLASQQLERFRVKRDSEGFSVLNPASCGPCYISNSLTYDVVPHLEYGTYSVSSRISVDNAVCPALTGNAYKISTTLTWGNPTHTVSNNTCLSDWQ